VTVAEDQIGSPTPIHPLAARLLMLAGRMGEAEAPRRLHLAGSPPVSRADWVACAFDALRAAGLRPPELIRAPMAALPSASPRPRFSALDCSRAEALFGSPILWRPAAEQPGTFTRTPSAR
jgi:dTDP-4-dehydrorhamnose reductase